MITSLVSLLSIIEAGPVRLVNGLCRPLDKGLPQEGRTLPAPVYPVLVATALGDRRDTGVSL